MMKDFHKALKVFLFFLFSYSLLPFPLSFSLLRIQKSILRSQEYERAMDVDPNNQDVVRGYSQTLQKIQETRGDKDRSERALQDPEIQQILREDQVQSVLQLLKNDPAAAQRFFFFFFFFWCDF